MDAGLVLEGVGPHNSLVGLDGHARVLLDHVGRRRDVDGVDARPQVRTATGRALLSKMRRSFESESHDDLLEGRVAGPFADAVDRALDLARAVRRARDRIGRT